MYVTFDKEKMEKKQSWILYVGNATIKKEEKTK